MVDNLEDGRNLYPVATRAGPCPFLGAIKDS
jgi:hypothetical protein